MQSSFLQCRPVSFLCPKYERNAGFTIVVPVLAALLAAFQEAGWRWAHQGHHLGEVLLVIEHAVLACKEKPAALV